MNLNQIILSVAFIILAFFIGYLCRKKIGESKISSAEDLSARIIDEANRDAESLKKDALISAKDEISKRKIESEQEISKKNNELATMMLFMNKLRLSKNLKKKQKMKAKN